MASTTPQDELFERDASGSSDHTVWINERCRLQTRSGYSVVSVSGLPLAHFAVGDRMAEAHAMVSLVEQGWAKQTEVAAAFNYDVRTVRRDQRRFERDGLAGLGRPSGYPKGTPRLPRARVELVQAWKADGVANREIARRLAVQPKAVRNLLRRLGWCSEPPEQLALGLTPPAEGGTAPAVPEGDPNLSGLAKDRADENGEHPEATEQNGGAGEDPNLSGSEAAPLPQARTLDTDPADRSLDRVMAAVGLLDDAAPLFGPATQAPAGVLLAVPALVDSGVFEIVARIYTSLGPAFYGLRTSVLVFLLMALLRIKRPEGLKEHSPRALGQVLGLDRAPEVKTLRRKLARLACLGRATELGRALAEHRVACRGHAVGFLYVDGHVRAYHGKRHVPKTHVARIRLAMPATTDYWVNDADGEPLFIVTSEANAGLVEMLPKVLDEVRSLVGERRVTVVFDRGGWSPKLFAKLLDEGFDILTYRKGHSRPVARSAFTKHEALLDDRKISYVLADQGTYVSYGPARARKRLRLRQVTRLSDDGHQTPILTSRRDLPAIEVAYRMFERWRQENFFKYLREEYALDALVDYGAEGADPTREVPNPRRKKIDAELRKARVELNQLAAEYGAEALLNEETKRPTMRGFKIANAALSRRIRDAVERVLALERKRSSVPPRVPVEQLTEGEVVRLRVERKHLTDLFKMVAYQAESDLVRLVMPHYRRAEQEGRTLIQSALATTGDISVVSGELSIALDPLSSPHRTAALLALCEQLNETATRFPGSDLRLHFEVKPAPDPSLAFPGPRPAAGSCGAQPDISPQG